MMHNAEKVIGIELTDKQEDMALAGVNRSLDSFEVVRKMEVPLDTEPAVVFHPALPGFHVKRAASKTKFRFGKHEPVQFKSVDDLAFATVPQLAELIRTKKISSVELTRMYLGRLKRYGPKLLCVVTLTEDLAMKQAQDADNDLKRGKYRGQLHGIPWGAKDLFATKGIKTTWGAEPFRDQMIAYDASWSPNFQWARSRRVRSGSAVSPVIPGPPLKTEPDRAAHPPGRPRQHQPDWWDSR